MPYMRETLIVLGCIAAMLLGALGVAFLVLWIPLKLFTALFSFNDWLNRG